MEALEDTVTATENDGCMTSALADARDCGFVSLNSYNIAKHRMSFTNWHPTTPMQAPLILSIQ